MKTGVTYNINFNVAGLHHRFKEAPARITRSADEHSYDINQNQNTLFAPAVYHLHHSPFRKLQAKDYCLLYTFTIFSAQFANLCYNEYSRYVSIFVRSYLRSESLVNDAIIIKWFFHLLALITSVHLFYEWFSTRLPSAASIGHRLYYLQPGSPAEFRFPFKTTNKSI